MKIIDLKCPNCGAKLHKTSHDTLHCESCQSGFLIDDETREYYITNNYGHRPLKEADPSSVNAFKFIILIPLIVVFLGLSLSSFISSPVRDTEINKVAAPLKPTSRELPESKGAQQMASRILHQPFEKLTPDDLATITYLDIREEHTKDQWQISYSVEKWDKQSDFKTEMVTIPYALGLEIQDFTSFTGLMYLNFNRSFELEGASQPFTVSNLDQLVYYGHYGSNLSPELSKSLQNLPSLNQLNIGLVDDQGVTELTKYPHLNQLELSYIDENVTAGALATLTFLTSLTFDGNDHSDLNWLSQLHKLKKLTINSATKVTDYSVLFSLTNLEILSIERGEYLKEISFINNMPKLKELSIKDAPLINLSPLKKKDSLTTLSLSTLKVTDYTPITTLENLKHVTLTNLSMGQEEISLASLPYLSTATVDGNSFSALTGSTTLTTLSLFNYSKGKVTELLTLPHVKTMRLNDTHLSNDGDLNHLTQLENLSLTNVTLNDKNINFPREPETTNIFKLINLKELTLAKAINLTFKSEVALNIDEMIIDTTDLPFIEAPNLTTLITDTSQLSFTIWDNEQYGYLQKNAVALLLKKIGGAPKLEILSLPEQMIEDCEFVLPLTKLTHLNLANNYLTSIDELTTLAHLTEVDVSNNPIATTDILAEEVNVIK